MQDVTKHHRNRLNAEIVYSSNACRRVLWMNCTTSRSKSDAFFSERTILLLPFRVAPRPVRDAQSNCRVKLVTQRKRIIGLHSHGPMLKSLRAD
eukprot:6177834-Pleurochrysis_carterae.AAC.3